MIRNLNDNGAGFNCQKYFKHHIQPGILLDAETQIAFINLVSGKVSKTTMRRISTLLIH